MNHPSQSALAAFRRGDLAPLESLEVSDHLQECESCRHAVGQPEIPEDLLGEDGAVHLSEDEIGLAAMGFSHLTHDAKTHLEECAQCRDEVNSVLQAAPAAAAVTTPIAKKKPLLPTWLLAVAAAVSFAAVLIGIAGRHRTRTGETIASLHDAGGELQLHADGSLGVPGGLSSEQTAVLAAVLQDHRLPAPGVPALQAAAESKLRGAADAESSFALVGPANEYALAQPEFRWQALPGATAYRVEIYSEDFQRVAGSGVLQATSWRPEKPLDSGKTYTWVVRASTPKGEVQAPRPPAAEARFVTIPQETQAKIDAANPQAHLLLAALYRKAGLTRLAMQQLEQLARENPNSDLPRELEKSLQ
ncbi:zf-HC2 domain-containing protein [Terriglobus albidus]|uniref:zf-HC2 domain-containing protein n=1 Tax=Terriglobus albidus TaxID=1592106 RepID=UPI0021DF89EB|nr:zf-HC2 domain-containing protein [Terriglobus albidus]